MRIGYVTPQYPPNVKGGGERSLQLLVENMINRGHDVEVLSFDEEPGDGFDFVERHPLESPRADVQNFKAFSKIKQFSNDKQIIHSYNMTFHPVVGLLDQVKTVAALNSYQFNYPYSISGMQTNPGFPPYRLFYDWICRRMVNRIDRFTVLSNNSKEVYSRFFSSDKIEVVPNMYDPHFPRFEGVESEKQELLYVGSLLRFKGVDLLINQMRELEHYNLRIVGDGSQRSKLEDQADDLSNVVFEGRVPYSDLPKYYERAGWFVHPARLPEPFGRTILEAMQMDTPVIAIDRGGPKDVLSDEQLVSDLSELPEKVESLDRDGVVREQRRRLENYSPEEIASRYNQIYNSLL